MGKKKWVRRVLLFKCLLFLWEWEREFGDCCLQLKTGGSSVLAVSLSRLFVGAFRGRLCGQWHKSDLGNRRR